MGGYAMTFPLNMEDKLFVSKESNVELSDIGDDSAKINLRATIYRYMIQRTFLNFLP
jgi:hypothetical protein